MSAIKDGRFPIMLDKERHLLFSLNAIDEMQDKFGGFDRLDTVLSGKDSIKNLRWLLTVLLNEGAADDEEPLTEKQVGKLIHTGNFADVKAAIFKSFSMGKRTTKRTSKKTQQRARNNRPCPPSLYRRNASSLERSRSMAHDTV